MALTRATRRLILAFDPARPSRFLAEMGLRAAPWLEADLRSDGRQEADHVGHVLVEVQPELLRAGQ